MFDLAFFLPANIYIYIILFGMRMNVFLAQVVFIFFSPGGLQPAREPDDHGENNEVVQASRQHQQRQ